LPRLSIKCAKIDEIGGVNARVATALSQNLPFMGGVNNGLQIDQLILMLSRRVHDID
jgi:hypothetical protein